MIRSLGAVRVVLSRHVAALLLGLGAAAVGLGILGYVEGRESFLNGLFSAIAAFALNYSPPPGHVDVALEVSRFLAPAVTATAAAAALWALLRDELDGIRAGRAGGHILVCGLGRHGLALVRSYVAAGRRVVAIDQDRLAPNVATARALGVPVIVGDATQAEMLRRGRADRAERIVCLMSSDNVNAAAVVALRGISPRGHQDVHCQVGNPLLDAELTAQSLAVSDSLRYVEWFSPERLAAKALLSDYFASLVQARRPAPSVPGFAVIGATDTARSLLIEAAKQWRSLARGGPDLDRLPVTVLAPDPTEWLAATRAFCRGLDTALEITVVDEHPLSTSWAPVECHVSFVTVEDPTEALATALHLESLCGTRPAEIVVGMSVDATGLAAAAAVSTGGEGVIHVVDVVESTCTVELVERTLIEELARENHRLYEATVAGLPASRSWAELREDYRASNRAAAAHHVKVKLPAAGLRVVPITDLGDARSVELAPEQIERLARSEHERWMEERTAVGWTFGETRDDTLKHHPDLLDWDELPERSPGAQEKDRMFVRELPRMLAACGYRLVPARRSGSVAERGPDEPAARELGSQ